MNEIIMSYIRPFALACVLLTAVYMEVMQLKVSEFFIGLCTLIVTWFFKSRDDERRNDAEQNRRGPS